MKSCCQGVTCGQRFLQHKQQRHFFFSWIELFSCSVQKLNFHGPHKMTTLSCFCTEELFPLYLYYMCDCIHGLRPENLVLVWKPSGFCFPRGLISRLRGTLWSSVKVHCYVRIPWNSQKKAHHQYSQEKSCYWCCFSCTNLQDSNSFFLLWCKCCINFY